MSDHDITYLTDVSLLTCVVQIGLGEGIRNFKASLKAGQDESQSKEGKG